MSNARRGAALSNRQSSLHQIPGSTHNKNDTSLDQRGGPAELPRFEARSRSNNVLVSHKVTRIKLSKRLVNGEVSTASAPANAHAQITSTVTEEEMGQTG
jgi:hypothetical protein